MWPQTLQMTRDECRGVLRRLELDSYSHVISVFRAQGSLSDTKVKLLEELRAVFHISQERHRAEARRVANDEQLSTIAEAICGPNTWQEWSREGRRAFPMLPRVAPQTALSLIANNVAHEVVEDNSKLPYPSETVASVLEEDAAIANMRETNGNCQSERRPQIVLSDPFKMPEAPIKKKVLKRSGSELTGSVKKRPLEMATKVGRQNAPSILGNNQMGTEVSNNIKKLYNNHTKMQQQKLLHQQQLQKSKTVAKKVLTGKRHISPHKAAKKLPKLAEHPPPTSSQAPISFVPNALQQSQTNASGVCHAVMENSGNVDVQLHAGEGGKYQASALPQIAASKKDITKNLTKLQLSTSFGAITPQNVGAARLAGAIEHHQTTSSTLSAALPKTEKPLHSTPVKKYIVEDRQLPPSISAQVTTAPQVLTLPQLSAAASRLRAINTTILPPGTKLTAKTKIVSPVLGLNAQNAEPSHGGGIHNSHKDSSLNVSSSSTGSGNSNNHNTNNSTSSSGQLTVAPTAAATENSSSGAGSNISSNSNSGSIAQPSTPLHTPPAVIQLQSAANEGSQQQHSHLQPQLQQQQQPTQSKVLTTKLLPIVLSGNASNLAKIETINSSGSGSNVATSATGATTYKSLSSPVIVAGPGQSSGSGFLTNITSNATIYRKPNIIKATGAMPIGKISVSNSGPQIISNIRLTPATSTGMTGTSSAQHQFLQQQLKNVSATGTRTSVKICQSPNGKVFIQPAHLDSGKTKLSGSLSHKILTSAIGTLGSGGAQGLGSQRVAIQKMHLISTPSGTLQFQQSAQSSHQIASKPTTISIGNKSNVILMSSTTARSTAGTINLGKNITRSPSQLVDLKSGVMVLSSSTPTTALKSVGSTVLGNKIMTMPPVSNASSTTSNQSTGASQVDYNQMITEDTPVDILNVPYVVENSNSARSVAESNVSTKPSTEPVKVLAGTGTGTGPGASAVTGQAAGNRRVNTVDSAHRATPPQQPTDDTQKYGEEFGNATDWEMELDQATIATKVHQNQSKQTTEPPAVEKHAAAPQPHPEPQSLLRSEREQEDKREPELLTDSQEKNSEQMELDENFDDVIVEEQSESETAQLTTVHERDVKATTTTEDDRADEVMAMDSEPTESETVTTVEAKAGADDTDVDCDAHADANGEAAMEAGESSKTIGRPEPEYEQHREVRTMIDDNHLSSACAENYVIRVKTSTSECYQTEDSGKEVNVLPIADQLVNLVNTEAAARPLNSSHHDS